MTANEQDARRAAWSAYWAAGGLHSCIGSFAGNYSGAIGEFWRGEAAALADGARVLDLATGNGALPLLFWDLRAGRALHVDAVDLAQVSPPWWRPDTHPGIAFHSGVAMERLPFADASFDLVASQFGFEYADRAPALAELLRVAGPRGRVALVMHHAGSVLVRVGRAEVANQKLLVAPDGLLDAAAAVIPWFAAARSGRDLARVADAHRDRERYNAAMRALATAIATATTPDLLLEARDHVQRLLAATGPDPAPALAALQAFRDALAAGALRSDEMVAHASTDSDASALVDAIRAARPGHLVECVPLRQHEGVLGWALRAVPAND
jgi:ubiquinone/menaquinone biosynthesis C-methylase UbiE